MVLILMAAGVAAGLVAGLFGIGGGFVVVPTLLVVFGFFGVDDEILMKTAVATSLATIVVTGFRSAYAHYKKGAVDMQIIKDWAPWIIIGAIIGTLLTRVLDASALKLIFSVGVFLMGLHFVFPSKNNVRFRFSAEMPRGPIMASIATVLGGFCAMLGIGGGTPAVMVMTACGRQIHQSVATAAGFGVLIAVPGTLGNMVVGWGEEGLLAGSVGYVNLIAAAAIVSMSVFTAPIGARLAHSLDAVKLKRFFGIYLLFTSAWVFYKAIA